VQQKGLQNLYPCGPAVGAVQSRSGNGRYM